MHEISTKMCFLSLFYQPNIYKIVFFIIVLSKITLFIFFLYRKPGMSALPPPGRRLHFIASRVVAYHGGRVMFPQHVAEAVAFS